MCCRPATAALSLVWTGSPSRHEPSGRRSHDSRFHGYHLGVKRLATSLLALSLVLPTPAWAAGLTPEQAEQRRSELERETDSLAKPAAIAELRRVAEDQGDPELFLAASELQRERAEQEGDEALALEAASLADTARDIALYLADERRFTATDWRPVTRERAETLADQAERAGTSARELAASIVAAREAAANDQVEEPSESPQRQRKPGTGLIAGGAAALTIGAGGIAMIGAGLAMGAAHQREAESLVLPAEQARLDQLDRQGAQANLISYIGIAVAGVGLATGIALVVVGVKRRKAAGSDESASLRAAPWFDARGAGLSVGGRF